MEDVFKQTIVLLTLESLARKNLIELERQNMSYCDGIENRLLARIKK